MFCEDQTSELKCETISDDIAYAALIQQYANNNPEMQFTNLPELLTRSSYFDVVCKYGHRTSGNVASHRANNGCVVCNAAVRNMRREPVNEMFNCLGSFIVTDSVKISLASMSNQVVLTCNRGHKMATTGRDVIEECYDGVLWEPLECGECTQEDLDTRTAKKFVDWIATAFNEFPAHNFRIEHYEFIDKVNLDYKDTVKVTCEHGHKTTDSARALMRLDKCPVCKSVDELEATAVISPRRAKTISLRGHVKEAFQKSLKSENVCAHGHVLPDEHIDRCPLCNDDYDIPSLTMQHLLNGIYGTDLLFDNAYINENDTFWFWCREHGLGHSSVNRALANSYVCKHCHDHDHESKTRVNIVKSHETGITTVVLTADGETPPAGEILFSKGFPNLGTAEWIATAIRGLMTVTLRNGYTHVPLSEITHLLREIRHFNNTVEVTKGPINIPATLIEAVRAAETLDDIM